MNAEIVSAIQNRRVLSLRYKGVTRLVQPHAYGRNDAGHDILRCYQVAGRHTSEVPHKWDLLLVSGISGMMEIGEEFTEAAPKYKRGDKGMVRIYAEI